MKYIDTDRLKNVIKRLADLYQDTFTDNMRDRLIDFIDACIPDIVLKKETTEDSLQQEQPDVNLEEETDVYLEPIKAWQIQEAPYTSMENIVRHFYELGKNAK